MQKKIQTEYKQNTNKGTKKPKPGFSAPAAPKRGGAPAARPFFSYFPR